MGQVRHGSATTIRSIIARARDRGIWMPAGPRCARLRLWDGLPGFRVLARRNSGSRPLFGDGVVTLARAVRPVRGDAGDLLIGQDLAEQIWEHGCIAYVATGDVDRPDFHCFLVDPEMGLAPDAAHGTALLARIPLTLATNIDARAVD